MDCILGSIFYRVHEDKNLREDKFQYLLSSLKPRTKARDIAESYPPSKCNYLKVIDHLKSRFGRKDLLIEVYIRDLLALVNSKSYIKLTDFYDRLGSYLRALETLGVTTSNYAAMLYPVVETCLPVEVLKAWDGYRLNREVKEEDPVLTKEKVIKNLMSFLRHEVEGEEHRALAETAFGSGIKRKDTHKQEILSQGLFGGGISPAAEHGRFTVTVESLDGKHSTSVSLLDQPKICSTLPRIRDENLLAELASRGIKLTDVGRDAPPIRILLGADVLGSILTGRIEILTSGVSAVKTLFGWTILGLGKKKQVVNMQSIEKLKKGFYVDNLTIGVENQEELVKFKTQTMEIMKAATFELRCWAHTGVQDQESQNVLGFKWDTENDEPYCVSPETDIGFNGNISKRKL
ncbi:transposable element Tc1 transposase [Trichonephila clavata]|uniref:Transposable element Tc1 transposase n=1 Tax=Trichonephila clavata TaxID=2740835 RepID=A0A8X6HGU7_TRICU|nr:transposable element Tc1 transposase [Trichonephila clavata]